ncbi:hypothetical protein KAR34_09985 [bacterium]|nr:hypothetical protein [bacterium]
MKFYKIIYFLSIIVMTLPFSLQAWPGSTLAGNCRNYYEEFDGGRTTTASSNYYLQGAIGSVWNQGAASFAYTLYQGFHFNINRDLNSPEPVTRMNAASNTDGAVTITWSTVADLESQVWGYRVYRFFYYGPQAYQTRLIDAPDNTLTAYMDTESLLA